MSTVIAPTLYSRDNVDSGRGEGDAQESRLTTMQVTLPLFFERQGRGRRTQTHHNGLTLVVSHNNGAIVEVISCNRGDLVDGHNGPYRGRAEHCLVQEAR